MPDGSACALEIGEDSITKVESFGIRVPEPRHCHVVEVSGRYFLSMKHEDVEDVSVYDFRTGELLRTLESSDSVMSATHNEIIVEDRGGLPLFHIHLYCLDQPPL